MGKDICKNVLILSFIIILLSSSVPHGSFTMYFIGLDEKLVWGSNITAWNLTYGYHGKPLSSLIGQKIYSFESHALGYREYYVEHPDRISELDDFFKLRAVFPFLSFEDLYVNLTKCQEKVIAKSVFYDNTSNQLVLALETTCSYKLNTDLGFFFYRVKGGNDTIKRLYVFNNSMVLDILKRINSTLIHMNLWLIDSGINVTILYYGISSESLEVIEEQVFKEVNGTYVPSVEREIKMVNPYHVFYILFDGIRIAFPIIYGVEDDNGVMKLKYIKAFIPFLHDYTWSYTIDQSYLNEIIDLYRNATGDYNATVNNTFIFDIFYYPTKDMYYLKPMLLLYGNNSKALIAIWLDKEPKLASITYLMGFAKPNSLEYWFPYEELFTIAKEHLGREKIMRQLMFIGIVLGVFTAVAAPPLIIIIKRYKRQRK